MWDGVTDTEELNTVMTLEGFSGLRGVFDGWWFYYWLLKVCQKNKRGAERGTGARILSITDIINRDE